MKRKLIDLSNQRAQLLKDAEAALTAGNTADYDAAMEKVTNLNTEIQRIQNLLAEQERHLMEQQPTPAEARDMAEERGVALMRGDQVKFSAFEVRRAILNQTTLATGSLVQPTGVGSEIRDPLGNVVSSIVDQVLVTDMSGMSSYMEPYVISELGANAGKVAALAGTARDAGTDPTFGIAEIKPYEINTTSYVDRNISNLSPANYYAKIQGMAMRAMRRKLAGLIVNGDGSASPTFYGMKTAKNQAGGNIYTTVTVSVVDVNLLDTLYFAYGSSDAMGPNARLLLTKEDLKAIGALRGANEKHRLFEIVPATGNPNTGTIRDSGVMIPYTICSDLTSLSTTTAGSAAALTMGYGDPINFEVGLFGDFTVRVDESVKAVERMHTILGDAMVGGNLIVDKGMVWASLPASGG